MTSPVLRICDSCKFYNEFTGTCKAFPKGIPLTSSEGHFEVHPDQIGSTTYVLDEYKYSLYDMFRRVHPEVKFPLNLVMEVDDEGPTQIREAAEEPEPQETVEETEPQEEVEEEEVQEETDSEGEVEGDET